MAELRADVEQLKNDLSSRVSEVLGWASTFARARPYVSVGAALGLGWVLGNGLHPRLAMGAVRLAYKTVIGSALTSGGLIRALGVEQDQARAASQVQTARGARRATPEGEARPRKGSVAGE